MDQLIRHNKKFSMGHPNRTMQSARAKHDRHLFSLMTDYLKICWLNRHRPCPVASLNPKTMKRLIW